MTPLEQAQATVVGSILENPDIAGEVFSTVAIDDLHGSYRAIAEAIHGLRVTQTEVSRLAVIDEMTRRGTISRFGGPAEVHRVAGFGFGDHTYALGIIARTARLRRLDIAALNLHQHVDIDDADPLVLAKTARDAVQGVIDTIEADGDITTPTLGEFLNTSDPEHDWVVPGLLERGDRMLLTGGEGLGKSFLQRQLAVCAAAGIHPFNRGRIKPQRVLYVDCENGPTKLRRALRSLVAQATLLGEDPKDRMFLEAVPAGLDLTRPEDEAWLVRRVASIQPALLFIGPIYRLHADDPNKEEPARKVTQVLDRCRSAANCALVAEAHAGHGYGQGERPLRPSGTSLWLRWPEFGYGMRPAEGHTPTNRRVSFQSWRGDREERDWPSALRSGGPLPWSIDFGFEEASA